MEIYNLKKNLLKMLIWIYRQYYFKVFSAASTVFSTSMAIVIGPTPPGTGVIAFAFVVTSSQKTSPQRLYPFSELFIELYDTLKRFN